METYAGPQLRADGRSHLPERGVALDREELFDSDAPRLRYPAQIVAYKVDNHYVFAAVLRIVVQPLGNFAIFARCATARRGALHGTRDNAACCAVIVDAEEELWRKRENATVWLPMQERSEVDRLSRAQP